MLIAVQFTRELEVGLLNPERENEPWEERNVTSRIRIGLLLTKCVTFCHYPKPVGICPRVFFPDVTKRQVPSRMRGERVSVELHTYSVFFFFFSFLFPCQAGGGLR